VLCFISGEGRFIQALLYLVLQLDRVWAILTIGRIIGWEVGKVGPVYMLFAGLGSLVLLGLGYWLSLVEVEGDNCE
jgi:hypothetical protein